MFIGIIKKTEDKEQLSGIRDRLCQAVLGRCEEYFSGKNIVVFRMDDSTSFFSCDAGMSVVEGVLYNSADICTELEIPVSSPISFIILSAYRKWGKSIFSYIDGKFSFVLIDYVSGTIISAIDRFGEQKLCYCHFEDEVAFSTSSKLLAEIENKREISNEALGMYFAHNYICAPYTIYKNIFKLAPGEYTLLESELQVSVYKYWRVQDFFKQPVRTKSSLEEVQKEIIDVLKNNIWKRWNAGEFGTAALFLSGGIDSAVLCGVISEMKDIPLIAYTASFKNVGKGYDESDAARLVAETYGVRHEVIEIDPNMLCDDVCSVLRTTDEPMANRTYSVASLLMKVASEKCGCIFTGDGGDEIFLGYPQYQRLCKAQNIYRVCSPFRKILLSSILRKFLPGKLVTILESGSMDSPEQMFSYNAVKTAKKAVLEVNNSLVYPAQDIECKKWFIKKNSIDLYHGTQAAIRKWNDIALKNEMIHYSPLLDSSIIRKANSIPQRYKMRGKHNKVILRDIIDKSIPAVGKLPKHGFNVPVAEWIRGPFRDIFEEITSEEFLKGQGLFDVKEIKKLKQIFLDGKSNYENDAVTFMWSYFAFQVWYKDAIRKE